MTVEASSWKAMTSAELVRRLRDADVPVPTTTGKMELVQRATHYLGASPQDLHTPEQIAALVEVDGRSDDERLRDGWPTAQISPQGEVPPDSVYARVVQVLAKLPAIGKDRKAPGLNYAYRGIEDITAALKPLLGEFGVFVVPSVLDREETVWPTKGGGQLHVIDLLVRFRFFGTEGDSFDAEVWGQGTDTGDKAVQKAMTSAFKSMLAVTFCISDSESDAEAHDVPETVQPPARVPASKDRVAEVAAAVKDAGKGMEKWVKDQGFLRDGMWPWTEQVCDAIEHKIARLTLEARAKAELDASGLLAAESSEAAVESPQGVLTDQAVRAAVDVPGGVDGYQESESGLLCPECDYSDGAHAEDCPSRAF